jgi:hypothetical protein
VADTTIDEDSESDVVTYGSATALPPVTDGANSSEYDKILEVKRDCLRIRDETYQMTQSTLGHQTSIVPSESGRARYHKFEMPNFDPNKEGSPQWSEYLACFGRQCRLSALNEGEKADFLRNKLKGDAATILVEDGMETASYTVLVEALNNRHDPDVLRDVFVDELFNI